MRQDRAPCGFRRWFSPSSSRSRCPSPPTPAATGTMPASPGSRTTRGSRRRRRRRSPSASSSSPSGARTARTIRRSSTTRRSSRSRRSSSWCASTRTRTARSARSTRPTASTSRGPTSCRRRASSCPTSTRRATSSSTSTTRRTRARCSRGWTRRSRSSSSGTVPTVYIETYGCQMNVADTELMLGHLATHGYARTDAPDGADVILLNTCAIREHAETRVLGRLGELARHKRRRPDVRLGVTGCMAQHLRERLRERAPYIDVLVGPDGYRRLPELLRAGDADPHVALRLDPSETYADLPVAREGGVRAWITAMRGCDRFCSFCIVPYVRGRERSLPGPALVAQVERLAGAGVREVVFLGQTVNAYHNGTWDFAELLRRTAEVSGIVRIRFTSPHPSDMSARLIDVMADCPAVAPQLHLPLQAGSDRVLERMGREYTVAEYEDLVARLRARVPAIALSTDVIVGFPGEDDADFAATESVVGRVR